MSAGKRKVCHAALQSLCLSELTLSVAQAQVLTPAEQALVTALSPGRQAKVRRLLDAVQAEQNGKQRAALQETLSKRLRKWASAGQAADEEEDGAAVPAASLPLLARPLAVRGRHASLAFDSSDPEERLLRAERAQRFASDDFAPDDGPPLRLVGRGTSTALEKTYLRLTSAPQADTVRPPEVLRRALAHVKQRWRAHPDYAWAGEQLQSIRQDLTVQHVRDELAVDTYETHARVALEMGDTPQFMQCVSVLRMLHAAVPGAGAPAEFAAYRVLFAASVGADALAAELRRLRDSDVRHAWVAHAMRAASAAQRGDAAAFMRLYPTAPRMSSYLMDALLPSVRAACLAAALAAYRPGCPLAVLARQLGCDDGDVDGQQTAQLLEWALAQGAARMPGGGGDDVLLTTHARAAAPSPAPRPVKGSKKGHRRQNT
jgi:hypothetical protein